MEISWSGIPGAAKKVSIKKKKFLCCIVFSVLSDPNSFFLNYYYYPEISVCIWDHVHVFLPDGFYRQVKQISGAHKAETNPATKVKKRRSSTRGMAPSVVSIFSSWLSLMKASLCPRGEADLWAPCLSRRIASRASQWFCFRISTPSSRPELLMGRRSLFLTGGKPVWNVSPTK